MNKRRTAQQRPTDQKRHGVSASIAAAVVGSPQANDAGEATFGSTWS